MPAAHLSRPTRGEVGPGEDADADEHADVREDRQPGAVGPGVGRCPAEAWRPRGRRQRTRISSPAITVTHQHASDDDRRRSSCRGSVLGRDQEGDPRDQGQHTGDGVHVDQPAAHAEPAGAPAAAAEAQPGQHHDDSSQRGEDVRRSPRSTRSEVCPTACASSPRDGSGASSARPLGPLVGRARARPRARWRAGRAGRRPRTSGSRGRPARSGPGAGPRPPAARSRARCESGRSSYTSAIGAPRPAASRATPPRASTTRIAKNHIMSGAPPSRRPSARRPRRRRR